MSYWCRTWLIHTWDDAAFCEMIFTDVWRDIHVWCDSVKCDATHLCVTLIIYMRKEMIVSCDVTPFHSYGTPSFPHAASHVTWLIDVWCYSLMYHVTHPHKRWVSVLCDVTLRICRDIHGGTPSFPCSILCDIIRECMMLLIDVSRDWITCATTQHSVWHYSLMYAITHTHVWRRSILCAITHWGMTWRWCVTGLSQVWRDTFKRDVHHLNVRLLGILCDVTLHIHACMGWLRLVGSP